MNRTVEIQRLLEPLEHFQRLHAETLRRFGSRAVDLAYPNPRRHLDERPYHALAEIAAGVGVDDLRYSPFGGFTTARRRVASALSERHRLPYTYHDVILTPGATAALNLALRELFTPPDRILVLTPCWMDYPLYLANLGLDYDLVPTDEHKHLDLAAIERAWTPQTRGLVISQPASPTGVCYHANEIAALVAMLNGLGATHDQPPLVVNDETHRDQAWACHDVPSPAHTYPHTVSVYSFGKAWQMQGQRIGYLAVHPHLPRREAIRERLVTGMRITGYCAPTALTQHLATALSAFTPELGPLAELQHHTRTRLRRSGHHVIDADATHFVYVRAPIADDRQYAQLSAKHGVLVMPSGIFHEPGYFRLALNTDGAALDHALDILADLNTARADQNA